MMKTMPQPRASSIHTFEGDSKPHDGVLESAYTQEIRMIWLLTALLVVALIVSSLRIGAWYLLKYDTGNRD
jgi:hypothetical protein